MNDHEFDVLRELVDHQVLDADGVARGKVDDLVLRLDGDAAEISALLVGVEPWAERLDRPLGRWLAELARWLDDDAARTRLPLRDVERIDSAVHLRPGAEVAESVLETWLSRHVIGRLPGGRHEP